MIEIDIEIKPNEVVENRQVKKKIKPLRIIIPLLILFLIFAGVGIYLFRAYENYANTNQQKALQEVQSQLLAKPSLAVPANSGDPYELYHEQVTSTLPYSQTKYKTINSLLYHFQFTYPVNTSALISNTSDDQIWILRNNGYMFKLYIYDQNKQTINDFYNSMSDKANFTATPVTFSKQPALALHLIDTTKDISGDEYIVGYRGYIFLLWYKTYKPQENTDDQKRVNDILKSFDFI